MCWQRGAQQVASLAPEDIMAISREIALKSGLKWRS
jgi:hypothetical protein